ncbi:unnamed protein product [Closterium sp. NIES-54]
MWERWVTETVVKKDRQGPDVEVAAGAAAEPATPADAATGAAAGATAAAATTVVAAPVTTTTWQASRGGGGTLAGAEVAAGALGPVVNGWAGLRAVGNGVGRSGGARSGLVRWNAVECGSGACGGGSVRSDAVGSNEGKFNAVGNSVGRSGGARSGLVRWNAVKCGSGACGRGSLRLDAVGSNGGQFSAVGSGEERSRAAGEKWGALQRLQRQTVFLEQQPSSLPLAGAAAGGSGGDAAGGSGVAAAGGSGGSSCWWKSIVQLLEVLGAAPLPRRPLFWEQQPSSLPLPGAAAIGSGAGGASVGGAGVGAGGAGAGVGGAGARAQGAGAGGADSAGVGRPSAGGVPGTSGPTVCSGGAGSGGASQPLPRRPFFWEQQPSSLPLPGSALHDLLTLPPAPAEPTIHLLVSVGHPSLQRRRSMHSCHLVSGFQQTLPPLPPSLVQPYTPCVKGQQHAAPHSSFPPTTSPLQMLHMDDLPVLRLHSDRGGEYSSGLLEDFCREEGITQSFTIPASPQQDGIVDRRINLLMEPETSPTFLWTGEMGDASAFRVWGSLALVPDPTADKLSPHTFRCVFLGFPTNVPDWQLGGKTAGGAAGPLRVGSGVLPLEVLGVHCSLCHGGRCSGSSGHRRCHFLVLLLEVLGEQRSSSLPLPGAAAGVSGGDAAGGSGVAAAGGYGGALQPLQRRALLWEQQPSSRPLPGAAARGSGSAEGPLVGSGGAVSRDSTTGGASGTGTRAGGAGAGAAGVGARGAGAGVGGAGAGAGAGVAGAGGADYAGVGRPSAGGVPGTGSPAVRSGGAGSGVRRSRCRGGHSSGSSSRRCNHYLATDTTPPMLFQLPDLSQAPLPLGSPLPAPPCYSPLTDSLTEHREPESCAISLVTSPVASLVARARRARCVRPPPVPSAHTMALCPSYVSQSVVLPLPPSSLPDVPSPESDRTGGASPTFTCCLATLVTDPTFSTAAASALIAELAEFAATCHLDYLASLASDSACPTSIGGELALGCDALEDRQLDKENLEDRDVKCPPGLPPKGDPDALDILTPCSYAEAITGRYSSQWETAMEAEMAS